VVGVVAAQIKKRCLFLGVAPKFSQFINAVRGAFLFSLALAFKFVALLLLARLFFLTLIEC
jgi:hypothetical protein